MKGKVIYNVLPLALCPMDVWDCVQTFLSVLIQSAGLGVWFSTCTRGGAEGG
jgi:hypothetical protein